ncbi:MAG: prolipoprotein diacylglyceryl transferase [Clostridia bacterium]|nr:prolipoprotein diacylglyceryl transferase [Clostridia bacterium]
MRVTIFGIDLILDPVAFTLPIGKNGMPIYWYGILIAIGFIGALVYAYIRAKRFNLDIDRVIDVVLVATPLAVLGARTYYVLFDPNGKISSVGEFFGLGGSGIAGLAIYGGIIGAVVGGFIMAKIRKVKILDLLDLAAIGFLIGQGIGRWGNFFNQEAFGSLTGSDWWGMTSENTVNVVGRGLVHPCFLYESIWCIAGAVLLHFLSNKRKFSGQIALSYCVWYGFGRTIIESFRTDSLMFFDFKVSQVLSVLICVAGIVGLAVIGRKKKTAVTDTAYESMFADELSDEIDEEENETEETTETEE